MADLFGLKAALEIKDSLDFISGAIFAWITATFVYAYLFGKVVKNEKMEKALELVRVRIGRIRETHVSIRHIYTFPLLLRLMLGIVFVVVWPKFELKHNEKSAVWFAWILMIIAILFAVIGIALATHPVMDGMYKK